MGYAAEQRVLVHTAQKRLWTPISRCISREIGVSVSSGLVNRQ